MKDKYYIYKILRFILFPIFILYFNPKIIGKENIPKEGSMILVGNHVHIMDQCNVIVSTKRCIHFLAKEELFNSFFGFFFRWMGLIPVKRKTKDGKALPESINYLENEK